MEKLEPCSLAMKCTGNFEHFGFLVKCFDHNNQFFGYDVFTETENLVLWNFTNKKEMTEFIKPLKKEISTVLQLLASEKMTVPDIVIGVYVPDTNMLILV